MSEETTEVTTEIDEATAAAAAFANARSDEPVVIEHPATVEPEPEPEKPRMFGRTEEEISELLGEIPSMKEGYRKQIDNLAGNIGSLKAAFNRMQQDTPKGEAVTVTDEDLAEMNGEFPELAGMTKSALNNVLKRINLRGSSFDPAAVDELVNTLVTEKVSKERVAIHQELLDGLNPGWTEIVGVPVNGVIPKTPYRDWLATQPFDYQNKINSSNNAFDIVNSVKSFQEAQAAIAKKQTQNKQRLINAIQPSGSVAARSVITEQQAAEDAFKRSRGR